LKVLFIGAINKFNFPQGGEEYKNQLILDKLIGEVTFKISAIDTYNWKKKPLLITKIFLNLLLKQFDSIVISASSASTYILLKIIFRIKPSILHKIHYLVIGGYFPVGIKCKRYDWEIYLNLKSVVVEGQILKDQILSCSELKNVKVIPNFKKFDYEVTQGEKDFNSFKFVFIGRISKAKGIPEIIEAVRILKLENQENACALL
jgi:glycosyltransferase involved in cell wall biosynthesis